jgi:hypothetical protein
MSLKEYLEKKHRPSTVKIYLFEIDHYIKALGEEKAQAASYQEVSDYLAYLRKKVRQCRHDQADPACC